MRANFKSIRELHDAYDKKSTTPSQVTEQYLAAIKVSSHNAYLTVCAEEARKQAEVATDVLAREGKVPRHSAPLFGVPIGVKDVLTTQGVRTTCASKILENYIPPYTATCVERLEKAGAIVLGKLNMDEFAMGGSNENSAFGSVKHPTHPDRVPGGSSGGSATAVGAALCLASIGSDTGGSIRLPASYCGVVGLKPTYGRVSRYGLIAFASSLDQAGPMTLTVEDSALLLNVMSGHDPLDSTCAPLPGEDFVRQLKQAPDWQRLRIGVPKEYFVKGLAPEVERAIHDSLKWFETQGAKLVPISLPHTQYSVAIYYLVAVSEASSNLARYDGVRYGVRPQSATEAKDLATFYKSVRANFGAEVKRRILLGTFALSSGYSEAYYKRACQVRRLIAQDFEHAFKEVDVIAGPVSPTTAFKLGEKNSDPLQMYLNDIFTIPANLAGLPAISFPCAQDSAGLPIGFQLMAPRFAEGRLLSVAHAFEQAHEPGKGA